MILWYDNLRDTNALGWALFSNSIYFMDFFFLKCVILGQSSTTLYCLWYMGYDLYVVLHGLIDWGGETEKGDKIDGGDEIDRKTTL